MQRQNQICNQEPILSKPRHENVAMLNGSNINNNDYHRPEAHSETRGTENQWIKIKSWCKPEIVQKFRADKNIYNISLNAFFLIHIIKEP